MTDLHEPVDAPQTLGDGRYRVVEVIGHGGVGTVYRVRDRTTGQDVAAKVLRPRLAGSKVETRFLREAEAMQRLRHPNIVRVDHVGRDGEFTWMTMELMDRGTAHALTKERDGLPVSWCLHIADCVLAGLQVVHHTGWVHRDVKPGNILLMRSGIVKIGDFGIVREECSDLTSPGVTLGTSAYMAPEQHLDATTVTPRSDLYALGATLFALATARTPRRLAMHNLSANEHTRSKDPFLVLPEVLQPLLRCACAMDPEDRFADAGEMRRAVRALLRSLQRPASAVKQPA